MCTVLCFKCIGLKCVLLFSFIYLYLLRLALAGNCPENRADDNAVFTINHCVRWHKSIHIMIRSTCVCFVFQPVRNSGHQPILSSVPCPSLLQCAQAPLPYFRSAQVKYVPMLFAPPFFSAPPLPSLPSFSIPSL